jgi:hypothetical protein
VDTTALARGWGDYSAHGPVPVIFRRWRAYLTTPLDPKGWSPYWSAADQRAWPIFDLTRPIAYQGFHPTVLEIAPAGPATVDTYVVKTLFSAVAAENSEVRPLALTRVYAVLEGGEWVFTNVLPRLTRSWPRRHVGPITYVCSPEHAFDRSRAEHAARFADSLAAAFEVPKLRHLDYYVTDAPEEMFRIMGLDWTVSGAGGYAYYENRQIFVGSPASGEAYLHELAHVVLAPLAPASRQHDTMAEGLATWTGGSLGKDYPSLMRDYAGYLRAHPEVTLDSVLAPQDYDQGLRPAGAVLCQMAHERGGLQAIRQLLASGRSDEELKHTLETVLGMRWPQLAQAWRARVLSFGG